MIERQAEPEALASRPSDQVLATENPQELQPLGRAVASTFKRIVEGQWVDTGDTMIPPTRRIAIEEERFRLWARTLGLFQSGHASLDYRIRDASFIKISISELLSELQDHLQNLLDIALGTRLPLEQDDNARRTGRVGDKSDSCNDDNSSSESSSESSLSSMGSFQETEFRLSSITTRLDSLYKLATRIRSPRNRPQRPWQDLYKHIPDSQRAEYIRNQEHIEISRVAYLQQQHLLECVDDTMLQEIGIKWEELFVQYASQSHWLVTRVGMANARRKQQFLYWKRHSRLLQHDVTEAEPAVADRPTEDVVIPQPVAPSQAEKQAPVPSMATSATKVDLKAIGPEDMRSVISHQSRVSTVASPRGKDLVWPPAPTNLAGHDYFPCPYCGILCPRRYVESNQVGWRFHLIHDLQPYHCTYEDCSDPGRLYGVRQEWLDHENQHRRVWHCHSHLVEFETQPQYMQHLRDHHPDINLEEFTPELIAAVVGSSSKPHRDCPFCPTKFSDVTTMQKHMRYHLERLALYAMPDTGGEDEELASENSSDSHQNIRNRGRQSSIEADFRQERYAFLNEVKKFGGEHVPVNFIDAPNSTPLSITNLQQYFNQPWTGPVASPVAIVKYLASTEQGPDVSGPAYQPNNSEEPRLACHFNKMDPFKYTGYTQIEASNPGLTYASCASVGFRDMVQLKEHFKYKHTPVQCDRCQRLFVGPYSAANLGMLSKHRLEDALCERADPSLREGITEAQWAAIEGWIENNLAHDVIYLTKRGTWFGIWKVLFPDMPPPESPWIDLAEPSSDDDESKPSVSNSEPT